jgi:hypothetical protein
MAELKFKVALNKGRDGINLGKFAAIAEKIQKFLDSFSSDIKLEEGKWIAENFRDGCVSFTNYHVGRSDEESIKKGQEALDQLTNTKTTASQLSYGLTTKTFYNYAQIASPLEEDDFITIGIYEKDKPRVKTRKLSKQRAIAIEKQIVHSFKHYGGMRGRVSALFQKSNKIHVTDSLTGKDVTCIFPDDKYNEIIRALQSRIAIVNVEGWMKVTNGEIEYLDIEKFRVLPRLKEGDLDAFFGCDPEFTGKQSTEQYLEQLHDEELNSRLIS